MTSGNGVGFEIFEFIDPPFGGPKQAEAWSPQKYTQGGFFHIAFTVPDPLNTFAKAEALSATMVGEMT